MRYSIGISKKRLSLGLRVGAVLVSQNNELLGLDMWYVDHCTLWTDIQVILITIKNVLMRKDINSATSATMEVFNGSN